MSLDHIFFLRCDMNVATAPLEPDNCGMTQSIAATPNKLVLPSINPPAHNCNKLKITYIKIKYNSKMFCKVPL